MYICIYILYFTCVYIYIYIYICVCMYRRKPPVPPTPLYLKDTSCACFKSLPRSLSLYIYIYICIYICVYIYTYIVGCIVFFILMCRDFKKLFLHIKKHKMSKKICFKINSLPRTGFEISSYVQIRYPD